VRRELRSLLDLRPAVQGLVYEKFKNYLEYKKRLKKSGIFVSSKTASEKRFLLGRKR